jgi:hypothetical protein
MVGRSNELNSWFGRLVSFGLADSQDQPYEPKMLTVRFIAESVALRHLLDVVDSRAVAEVSSKLRERTLWGRLML